MTGAPEPSARHPGEDELDSEESQVAMTKVDSDAGHWTPEAMKSAQPAERRLDPPDSDDGQLLED